MKTVARIITRLQGEEDGLFIGVLFKNGKGILKPNTIYEIVDILGALTIQEVGQASGAGPDNCSSDKLPGSDCQFHWGSDIGYILGCHQKSMFLTGEEYKQEKQEKYLDL